MSKLLISIPISTPDGEFMARYSEDGLAELNFPKTARKSSTPTTTTATLSKQIRAWHRLTEAALKSVLSGKEPKAFPPMAPVGTAFQKSVWKAMSQIALGKTKSYGEVAAVIGRPKAVRAVGGACGANPIPVLVPCHRVLAANNKIGGFGGGLGWKSRLLEAEGVYPK
jgi:methylated-DNA-[protein]-cysteine S-methyltransferase